MHAIRQPVRQSATAAENQLLATDRKRREKERERGAFVNVEEEEGIIYDDRPDLQLACRQTRSTRPEMNAVSWQLFRLLGIVQCTGVG